MDSSKEKQKAKNAYQIKETFRWIYKLYKIKSKGEKENGPLSYIIRVLGVFLGMCSWGIIVVYNRKVMSLKKIITKQTKAQRYKIEEKKNNPKKGRNNHIINASSLLLLLLLLFVCP